MVRIAWRMLVQRPASMIATFLALALAVTIVTTCGAMLESGLRFHGTVARYAGAPVLVATTSIKTTEGSGEDRSVQNHPLAERGRLDPTLPNTIAALPGVRAAIADVATPAQLTAGGASAAVELHPWSAAQLAPFTVRSGSPPLREDQVVLDQPVAAELHVRPGMLVRLGPAAGAQTFTVAGIAATSGPTPQAASAFIDDAVAGRLAGGGPQVIGVLADPGVSTAALASAVRHALPPLPERPAGAYPKVFVGSDRGSVESLDVDNAREIVVPVSSVFGGSALLIAVLVIAGTVGLSVKQRHRDIALLRALAATPRQVRRMVVREALALGVVAAAAGVWPGLAGARWLRDQYVAHGMVPSTFRTHLSWLPPVVAAASALLIAVVAAWIASLRASRIRPTEALGEASVERGGLALVRAVLGLVALGGGIVLCLVSASVTGDSAAGVSVATVFTLVVSVALLSPVLIRAAAATFGIMLRMFGVTGRLAAANTATSARRLSAVVSSLVLAVALGGSLWFVQTSEVHVAAAQTRAGLVADDVVSTSAAGLPPSVADTIRRTDGVVAATGIERSTLFSPKGGVTDFPVQGVDTAGLARTMDLGIQHGNLADLHGDAVAVDRLAADTLHLHVGQQFHGWFGDGAPADLRVVAIYARGLGFAEFTVPREVLAPHTSGLDQAILVKASAGRAGVAATVRSELAQRAPGATVLASDAYRVQLNKDLAENAWTNQMVVAVLLIYVVIAAVNTLVMYALGRRREFAVLRLSGTTRLQVIRMVRLEQVLLLGLAMALGTAIAAATLIPMVKGLTGSATPYIPPAGWAAVIGGVVLLGGLATVAPVRRVLGMRPVDAIGLRE